MPYPPKRIHNRVRAIIFDLDDTLIDWSGQLIHGAEIGHRHLDNVYHYLQTQPDVSLNRAVFFDCFGEVLVQLWTEAKEDWSGVSLQAVMSQTLQACGVAVSRLDLNTILQVYDWQPVPGVRPYPDAHSVLETLQQSDYRIGLVTNSMQPMWMRDVELEAYGFMAYLDARITSGDTGYMKPHPAIYERILTLLEVPAAQAVFVGDRPANDIAGANEAGLISVLMRPGHLDYHLNGVQPDFTITNLSELLPILADLEKDGNGQL